LPKKDQGVDSKCIDRRNENKKFDGNKLKNHQSFVNIMKKGKKMSVMIKSEGDYP
jgi:hypothetical protein